MGNNKDSLGDRMKGYELTSRAFLTRRIPVIIRIDGKAFHTFTKGLHKPFDPTLMKIMQETMRYLCANVQGCVFGYTQSDEITLVLTDYATIKTDAWFGYNVQKMASTAASMATLEFNRLCYKEFQNSLTNEKSSNEKIDAGRRFALMEKQFKACFDARCFSVPIDEVCNCLLWRQQDAIRNSIEAVGHAYFSQSQLNGKPCSEIQYMLFMEKCIDWNSFPSDCKRGAACYRVITEERMEDPRNPNEFITIGRRRWRIDTDIPIFSQDRNYVERFL